MRKSRQAEEKAAGTGMPQEDAKKAYVTQVGTSQMGDLICERI